MSSPFCQPEILIRDTGQVNLHFNIVGYQSVMRNVPEHRL